MVIPVLWMSYVTVIDSKTLSLECVSVLRRIIFCNVGRLGVMIKLLLRLLLCWMSPWSVCRSACVLHLISIWCFLWRT